MRTLANFYLSVMGLGGCSNALKQHNQATIFHGSTILIPYVLLALSAMNIYAIEWRSFVGVYWVFTLSMWRCFSIKLKQENQSTIHQGSSTWIPYFGLLTNSVRCFLWCSGSVCSRILSPYVRFWNFFFCQKRNWKSIRFFSHLLALIFVWYSANCIRYTTNMLEHFPLQLRSKRVLQ